MRHTTTTPLSRQHSSSRLPCVWNSTHETGGPIGIFKLQNNNLLQF